MTNRDFSVVEISRKDLLRGVALRMNPIVIED